LAVALAAALLLNAWNSMGDQTWLYAVRATATVQANPPQITLTWENDPYGVTSFSLYRKSKTATSWGNPIAVLSGTTLTYTDTNVSAGGAYEYQLIKDVLASEGFLGYQYIYAGINALLIEARGKLLLIVATNSTVGLDYELGRLQTDLVGDGWQVIRHDVSSNDTPASVKSLIVNDYNTDPVNVNTVFLFGHVPILESGDLNYDGHEARPMPADSYYGDIDGDWSSSPGYLPSDVELMVGRVDLANMPGNGAIVPWPSETELLRNYLNKEHNWRYGLLSVQPQALVGDLRGVESDGETTAATGYRNLADFVGASNTFLSNVSTTNNSPFNQRWISYLAAGSYLWAYGCGAGQPTACSGLGTNDGNFYEVYSTDIMGVDAKAVFVMLFGSWFGNWDGTDNLLRSVLATPTMGLTCCLAGRPHWFLHHMAMGETIGYSTRLSMNNSTLYQNWTNPFARAIYVSLMGDPSLRMEPVAPPSGLNANPTGSTVSLSWTASPDTSLVGYNVYRATSPAGPFSRLTSSPLTGSGFSDTGVPAGNYTYMVRAIKLQQNNSGTYYDPSQGIFATASVGGSLPPLTVQLTTIGGNLVLSWNSQPGVSYHVLYKTAIDQPNWNALSTNITASGTTTTWADGILNNSRRFYRVTSP
jgi:hypothetical protein